MLVALLSDRNSDDFDVDELIEAATAKGFPHVERWSEQWRR